METITKRTGISRRHVFPALLAATISPTMALDADTKLIELGREFDVISTEVDRRISSDTYIPLSLIERLVPVLRAISALEATTVEELRVKARVVSWDLSGDLQPGDRGGIVERMSLAIVRDLLALSENQPAS